MSAGAGGMGEEEWVMERTLALDHPSVKDCAESPQVSCSCGLARLCGSVPVIIRDLHDALDALRAERDALKTTATMYEEDYANARKEMEDRVTVGRSVGDKVIVRLDGLEVVDCHTAERADQVAQNLMEAVAPVVAAQRKAESRSSRADELLSEAREWIASEVEEPHRPAIVAKIDAHRKGGSWAPREVR